MSSQANHRAFASHGFSCLLIVVATFILYGQSLSFPYLLYDDLRYYLVPVSPQERVNYLAETPLPMLLFDIEKRFLGPTPWISHLINITCHAASTCVLYFVFLRFTTHWPRWTMPASLVGALLWSLHPQRVEAVAWVSSRKDILCGLFFFAAVYFYDLHLSSPASHSKSKRHLIMATVCYLLSILSKSAGVCFPVIALILQWYRSPRGTNWWRIRDLALFGLIAGGRVALTYFAYTDIMARVHNPLSFKLTHSGVALGFYLSSFLMPVSLSPYYYFPEQLGVYSSFDTGAAIATWAIVVSFLIYSRTEVKSLIIAFVATLLPVLGFVSYGYLSAADRYAYIPSAVLCLSLVLALLHWRHAEPTSHQTTTLIRAGRFAPAIPVCLLIIWITLSWPLIKIWSSDEKVLQRLMDTYPNFMILEILGDQARERQDHRQAMNFYRMSRDLNASNPLTHYRMAICAIEMKLPGDALLYMNKALELDPENAQCYLVRAQLQTTPEARQKDLEKAYSLDPSLRPTP